MLSCALLLLLPLLLAPLLLAPARAAPETVSFVVVGDTQTDGDDFAINDDVFPRLVEDMEALDPDVFIVVGDLVGGSASLGTTVAQWQEFKDALVATDAQVLLVPGNHDVYGGDGTFAAFRETFDWLPTDDSPDGEEGVSYYVDVANVRFVGITSDFPVSNPFNVSADGLIWLDRVLSESDGFDQVFVFSHHPVSFSDEGGLGTTLDDFWQTLLLYDVTGFFAGHWHRYQPGQLGGGGDTWETIIGTGGGYIGYSPIREYQQRHGFLLVEVAGGDAEATFYGDEDGDGHYDDVVDRFTMRSSTPLASGLVARYSFDDGQPTDSAVAPPGRGIDGELRGDAHIVDQVLELDGDDDYVLAGAVDSYAHAILGDLTLSLWVRIDELRGGEWSNALLCHATNDLYTEDEETNYAYWLNVESDGRVRVFWEFGSGTNVSVFSDPTELADGGWHHLAVVRDTAAGTVRFAVDGEPVGAPVTYERLPTGANRGMLYLGSDTEGAGSFELHGALDEVCIFDRALAEEDLVALAERADCLELVAGEGSGDGGTADGGSADGGTADGGTADGGTADGGTADGGTADGGSADGGDGGSADGGTLDGGPGDAGSAGGGEGCGCVSSGAPAGRIWAGLLPLLLVFRRRSG